MIRPMRIIFKPFSLQHDKSTVRGEAYWRATTDFPCTKNGKPMFGTGVDRRSALSALCTYLPSDIREALQRINVEKSMYIMPDQVGFTFWQLNLDGSVPSKDVWMYERQYFNTFGHLPID